MSGLVGWVDFRRDLESRTDVVAAMTETMRNRGPDGSGVWVSSHAALGHCRVAPRDRDAAEQPVRAAVEGGTVAACLVGRFYNAPELRRDLAPDARGATPDSDAEILLAAYVRWGEACVEHLRGMFAFAVWDERARRLLLARDRIGVKSLYYYEYPGGLLFASEPKGIMANPQFEARLDPTKVPILLQPRLEMSDETPLAGLHQVPPAHTVTYPESGLRRRRYWKLESRPHAHSFHETAQRVRSLLEDAVAREVATDADAGAMLSGGIDSTSVVALALQAMRARDPSATLDTFCIRFESDSEHFRSTELRPALDAPYARKAAEFLGSRHHTVTAAGEDLQSVLPATRRARDLPAWGQFDASMYLLFREMQRGCRVALSGEAADEFLGGYPYLFDTALTGRDDFPWLGDGPRLADCLSEEVTRHVDPRADERARYDQLLSEVPRLPGEAAGDARMREVLYLGMAGPLQVILDRKDRMSASLGLDVRIPFCDHRFVEYVWNVPWAMKSKGGAKGLLREAMKDVLPPCTMTRKKSAYPHVQSPEYDGGLIDEARRIVSDSRSGIAWMFDTARTTRFIDELASGHARGSFPGGSSPAYLLVHIVEVNRWIEGYGVCVG